jgi:hypothetical protein
MDPDIANRQISAAARAQISAAVQGRTTRGFEDEILRMEARVPGLGGIFLDPATGQAVAHVRSLGDRTTTMLAIRSAATTLNVEESFRSKIGVEGAMIIREGSYAFSELVAWSIAVASKPRLPGLVSIDADERLNRVRLGITDDEVRARVIELLASAGVPEAAVAFDIRGNTGQLLATVRNRVRATAGGLQIQNSGTGLCTLGFNVDVAFYGDKGFLTASHCATGAIGSGTTGDTIYQNTKAANNRVGKVHINLPWNSTDPSCGGISLCTSADAMFVRAFADTTSANWQKRIARTSTNMPTNSANGSLTIDAFYVGIAEVPFLFVGATVFKVGRTTGGTSGTIGATCDYPLYESIYAFLCVARVDNASNGPGDSGAPVFYRPAGTEPPYAIGILFAGGGSSYDSIRCTAGCYYHFSEWYAIGERLSRYFIP